MLLYLILFPSRSRVFPGIRWLNIGLRTLHLIGIAGLGGAYLYSAEVTDWLPYLWLTLLSGFSLMGISLYSNGVWLVQLRGMVILLKLLLLLCLAFWPILSFPGVLAVIVLSSFISHAPGNLRYYSLWHRRRIEHL